MTDFERRLRALERRCAADLDERMLQIAAAELGIAADEFRGDVQQLAVEARGYADPMSHIAAVAESLDMIVADLEREAHRLETAALLGAAG